MTVGSRSAVQDDIKTDIARSVPRSATHRPPRVAFYARKPHFGGVRLTVPAHPHPRHVGASATSLVGAQGHQRLASFGMVLGNPAAQLLRERSMIRSSGLVRQARRILHLAARVQKLGMVADGSSAKRGTAGRGGTR